MKTAKQSVELLDWCGDDKSVVNAARVSFAKTCEWFEERDARLITYLALHKHKSPFNHCFMSFRVKAPIFVARQLVKHEYLPWNEVSRRYVTEEPEFYFPDVWRKKADNVKQGSSSTAAKLDFDNYLTPYEVVANAFEGYYDLLEQGVCAEQARMLLPQNTMTEWVWSGTLFAFAKMCKLRLDPHTQKETQEIAKMIDAEAKKLYPVSWVALMEYGE